VAGVISVGKDAPRRSTQLHRHRMAPLAALPAHPSHTRGQLELLSRIIVSLAFTILGTGGRFGHGCVGLFRPHARQAANCWRCHSVGHLFLLAILSYHVDAFTNNPDSSDLLRFPLSYGSYYLFASPMVRSIRPAPSARSGHLEFLLA